MKILDKLQNLTPQISLLFDSEQAMSKWMTKTLLTLKKYPELLKCKEESLLGSIMFFADINLPFNTPEGYGYIISNNGYAIPMMGYKGLIEIAYRNKKIKGIRIGTVYKGDIFEYQMGTNEYIKHIPNINKINSFPIAAYAVAQIEGLNPAFTVIVKYDLLKISQASLSWNYFKSSTMSTMINLDINHLMQAKATIKQLFKTLPKGDNEKLIEVLDVDNKLDFERNIHIGIENKKYKLFNNSKFTSLSTAKVDEINVKISSKKLEEIKSNE